MTNDPYAAPSADLDNSGSAATIPTSIWTGRGRLSVASFFGQSFVLMLVFLLVLAAFGGIAYLVGGGGLMNLSDDPSQLAGNPMMLIVAALLVILYLVGIYITICMTIKRLHDRNHSGWWAAAIFIGSLIPLVNIVALIGMIYVYCFPGNKTGNRFGGRRETKGWEKVCAILYLVTIVAGIVGGGLFMASAMSGA